VAADAELRSSFNQVVIEFLRAVFSGFVGDVAGVAAHVDSGVMAAILDGAQPDVVTSEAEIFVLPAGHSLQQQTFVGGSVRVVTFKAIIFGGGMDDDAWLRGVFVGVTFEAEIGDACSFQVYARGLTRDADHVARQTSHINRRMYVLAFAFIFVTLETLRSVGSLFEGNGMHGCERAGDNTQKEQ
jgi:hypothetical protein